MTEEQALAKIVERILRKANPEGIVLFGSRARGDHRPGRDYDLLVIQDSAQPRYHRACQLYAAMADLPVEVEVMVYTPGEVREWSGVPEAFVTTAIREGRLLYERPR